MNRIKNSTQLLLLLVTLFVCSCGPSITVHESFEKRAPRKLAFLPVKTRNPIEPRKVAAIKEALRIELESKGFLFIADDVVTAICKDNDCSDQSRFFRSFSADATVLLTLIDVSRASFGLGYSNTVEGTVVLKDKSGTTLVDASHSESERGGIIFDSGQIVRGIRDQISSSGDTYFKNLARTFARSLVSDFPEPPSGRNAPGDPISIEDVTVTAFGFGFQKICANGSPGQTGNLKFGRVLSSLRETEPGTYCAIVSIPETDRLLTVYLTSPWGSSDRKEVSVTPIHRCDVQDNLRVQEKDRRVTVQLQCALLGNARELGCTKPINCSEYSLKVYRTEKLPAPFSKLKQTTANSWTDTASKEESTRYFGLLVDEKGFALPAFPIKER